MTEAIAAVTGHGDAVVYHNGCPQHRQVGLTGFIDACTVGVVLLRAEVPAEATVSWCLPSWTTGVGGCARR
ncbi:hypothetical protein ACOBQB_00545 [Streptomyces sp. G5(2025)]|uniref:hypothetical protein n=1 Tax=Streptomyces sp. G5(2025) TaxID=3406628 RepID=UPI003C1714E7